MSLFQQANVLAPYEYMLVTAISQMSTDIQQRDLNNCNKILGIDNKALMHIDALVMSLFNSILFAKSKYSSDMNSPEAVCSKAMSASNYDHLNVYSSDKPISAPKVEPILSLSEAEFRVRQVMPFNYGEDACSHSMQLIDKCRVFLNTSKLSKLLKSINEIPVKPSHQAANNTQIAFPSTNPELAQHFCFPIDHIHAILSKEIFASKLDLFVTVFLVHVLEFVTKDVLRLTIAYVKHLNKHTINTVDVQTSIQGDPMLTKIFYSCKNVDEDFTTMTSDAAEFEFEDEEQHNMPTMTASTVASHSASALLGSNTSNNEECTSDSSTICTESVSFEALNAKYAAKVKELVQEQSQYLNDLNVLRRIFMHLFKKCCNKFDIKPEPSQFDEALTSDQIIENIFGNYFDSV